jgi:cell wall assembly regulator SMI1
MSVRTRWEELVALRKRLDGNWALSEREEPSKFDELQHALGFRIPDDLLAGIRLYAGASEAWSEPNAGEEDSQGADSAESYAAEEQVFDYGAVSFLTLEAIVSEYEQRRALVSEMEPPEFAVGPVRPRYFDKHWIPIAADVGAGRFALDLNPAKGGVKGQVIWMQDEASVVRVVASSVEQFLEYGCECLRYELGEVNVVPQPPFQRKRTDAELGDLLADPECGRVAALWKRIVQVARATPPPSEFGVEFHKPSSQEQIRRLEKRMRTVFPKQLVCSLRIMGQANGMWLQPGKFESRPIAIGLVPEVVAWNKMFRTELERGEIVPHGVPDLPDSLAFVLFANAGGFRDRMDFYVACSSVPHSLVGKVLLRHGSDGHKDVLTLFADSIASFLEQGLALMQDRSKLIDRAS